MKRKYWLWALFVLYLAVLLRITVFRSGFGSHALFSNGQLAKYPPFVGLLRTLRADPFAFAVEFVGNLIWFIPFGLLLPVLTRQRNWTILWTLALSFFIEAAQFAFGVGCSDATDLILNTAGGAMGYGLFHLLQKRQNRRSDRTTDK